MSIQKKLNNYYVKLVEITIMTRSKLMAGVEGGQKQQSKVNVVYDDDQDSSDFDLINNRLLTDWNLCRNPTLSVNSS